MPSNAVTALGLGLPSEPAQYDLAGPTVDDDVRRIVGRYGHQAVRDAVKRTMPRTRGRKAEKDWLALRDVINAHALEWLSGADPFKKHSNYAIAQAHVAAHPGHNPTATFRRLQRKLAKGREQITLICAVTIAEGQYSHEIYLKAIAALIAHGGSNPWEILRSSALNSMNDYTQKFGPPDPELTMKEIEERSRHALSSNAIGAPGSGIIGLRRL